MDSIVWRNYNYKSENGKQIKYLERGEEEKKQTKKIKSTLSVLLCKFVKYKLSRLREWLKRCQNNFGIFHLKFPLIFLTLMNHFNCFSQLGKNKVFPLHHVLCHSNFISSHFFFQLFGTSHNYYFFSSFIFLRCSFGVW
jgi:hypothetical protein